MTLRRRLLNALALTIWVIAGSLTPADSGTTRWPASAWDRIRGSERRNSERSAAMPLSLR